jgi:hypothetical protein
LLTDLAFQFRDALRGRRFRTHRRAMRNGPAPRPSHPPLEACRPLLAVRIAPAVQHAAFDLQFAMQRSHAFAVQYPLRHIRFELLAEDTVFS